MTFSWIAPAVYVIAIGVLVGAGAIVWFLVAHSRWRGSVDTDRTNFEKFMAEIREKIDKIFDRLGSVEGHLSAVSVSQSPIRLNSLGESVSGDIGAKEWAGRLVDAVRAPTRAMGAYDVQQFCFAHADDMQLSDDEQDLIKDVAFNRGVSEFDVRRVLGIELRDKVLALRGMPLEETDNP